MQGEHSDDIGESAGRSGIRAISPATALTRGSVCFSSWRSAWERIVSFSQIVNSWAFVARRLKGSWLGLQQLGIINSSCNGTKYSPDNTLVSFYRMKGRGIRLHTLIISISSIHTDLVIQLRLVLFYLLILAYMQQASWSNRHSVLPVLYLSPSSNARRELRFARCLLQVDDASHFGCLGALRFQRSSKTTKIALQPRGRWTRINDKYNLSYYESAPRERQE